MEVQVMHTLTGLLADVGHHPVALQAQLPAQPGDDLKNVGHHGAVAAVYLRHGANVILGDHQKVGGSLEFPIVKDTTPNITNSRLNNIP